MDLLSVFKFFIVYLLMVLIHYFCFEYSCWDVPWNSPAEDEGYKDWIEELRHRLCDEKRFWLSRARCRVSLVGSNVLLWTCIVTNFISGSNPVSETGKVQSCTFLVKPDTVGMKNYEVKASWRAMELRGNKHWSHIVKFSCTCDNFRFHCSSKEKIKFCKHVVYICILFFDS